MPRRLLVCSCAGSQPIDTGALERGGGVRCSRIHSALCTHEAGSAAEAMRDGTTDLAIACQQERAVFEDLAADLGVPPPGFVDLRDRAGWSDEAARAGPKMAALAAEAALAEAPARTVDVASDGVCLIAGPGEAALAAAAQAAEALSVTVLITDGSDPPDAREIDVIAGRVRRLRGALGRFEVEIDALRQVEPSGRGPLRFGSPRDGGRSQCDIVLDLTGGAAMVPAPGKREGYLRADPRDPAAIARAVALAVQMTGTFEKPLYVRLEESLCAHARAGQTGCTRCLDLCPTGAIAPQGDAVAIDPMVCAGCGACAAACPSGAIAYDAPPFAALLRRIEVLAAAFRAAGGIAPRLLVHDQGQGAEMIRLAARHGRGLPADVVPLGVAAIAVFGHAEILAALAHGFAAVDVLLMPGAERDGLDRELPLAEAVAGPGRLRLLDLADPDALSEALYTAPAAPAPADPVLPLGSRRQVARLAGQALNPDADAPLPLPAGAPYGAVLVDTGRCTLCLSCVSLCPSGALLDSPDRPELRFQEDACLQCGLCRAICPETAITLEPRLDLSPAALEQRVLNTEEPFPCVECGKPFGVRSTIERITEKLAGKHGMFGSPDAARLIQMCDDCRVAAQFKAGDAPFAAGPPRRVRTSDDYYSDRKDH